MVLKINKDYALEATGRDIVQKILINYCEISQDINIDNCIIIYYSFIHEASLNFYEI